jgi:hypothetical protein
VIISASASSSNAVRPGEVLGEEALKGEEEEEEEEEELSVDELRDMWDRAEESEGERPNR